MVYALHEALVTVHEEGLEARWARHATAHAALRAALAQFGFERLAPEGEHLNSLLAVRPPEGVDEAAARGALLSEHDIEVSPGAGQLAGQVWRIGVMGNGAHPEPQERLVTALGSVLDTDTAEPLRALYDGWAA